MKMLKKSAIFWVANLSMIIALAIFSIGAAAKLFFDETITESEMIELHDMVFISILSISVHFVTQMTLFAGSIIEREVKYVFYFLLLALCDYGLHQLMELVWVMSIGG